MITLLVCVFIAVMSFLIGYNVCKSNSCKPKVKQDLITSNPPAREVALINRQEFLSKELKSQKDYVLKRINEEIKKGNLNYYQHFKSSGYEEKRFSKQDVYLYLVGRELRKQGFKVKIVIKKRMDDMLHTYNPLTQKNEYIKTNTVRYSKQLKVSW